MQEPFERHYEIVTALNKHVECLSSAKFESAEPIEAQVPVSAVYLCYLLVLLVTITSSPHPCIIHTWTQTLLIIKRIVLRRIPTTHLQYLTNVAVIKKYINNQQNAQ